MISCHITLHFCKRTLKQLWILCNWSHRKTSGNNSFYFTFIKNYVHVMTQFYNSFIVLWYTADFHDAFSFRVDNWIIWISIILGFKFYWIDFITPKTLGKLVPIPCICTRLLPISTKTWNALKLAQPIKNQWNCQKFEFSELFVFQRITFVLFTFKIVICVPGAIGGLRKIMSLQTQLDLDLERNKYLFAWVCGLHLVT